MLSRVLTAASVGRLGRRIACKCGSFGHLAGEIPAAILADIVGVHVATAGAWADIAGRPWGDYPSLREPNN